MKLIAYDLGTGGVKASLYDEKLAPLAKIFLEYRTYYPRPGWHEQRPEDWWDGIARSTRLLLKQSGTSPAEVACAALSGHSLAAVPIGTDGECLSARVPIWSDTRAAEETAEFFSRVEEENWYMKTGNGFPPACYPMFKLMWMKKHRPELYQKTACVLGSKDYINYRLTGVMATDPSYLSGSGAYLLEEGRLSEEFLSAAGIAERLFPPLVPSHQVVGRVTREAAAATGLGEGTAVACGGVDNACMAMGASGVEEGRCYVSLGSSAWIPVNSSKPVLEPKRRPYVFAHLEPGMFTSAFSIFSAGSALRWVRDTLCPEFADCPDAYQRMDGLAAAAPVGSGGVMFQPSLAGGNSQDQSLNLKGAFVGLTLGSTRGDLIRAAMEGVAFNLYLSCRALMEHTRIDAPLLFCGGGSRSPFWMQMFADVFGMEIIKTNIDQDAASLGAAAVAMRAVGALDSYSQISALHQIRMKLAPDPGRRDEYQRFIRDFQRMGGLLCAFEDGRTVPAKNVKKEEEGWS